MLIGLLADHLADAGEEGEDLDYPRKRSPAWGLISDVSAAAETIVAALRWLSQEKGESDGGRHYIDRIADRLDEVDATLAAMLD